MQLRVEYIINFIIGSIAGADMVDGGTRHVRKMIASKLIIFAIHIGDISIYFLN